MEKVLVTGASGFIATHCINELLKRGFSVKGSLRDLNRELEVRKSLMNYTEKNRLEFCKLDLLNDNGWSQATEDCDYLMHIASPYTLKEPKNEETIITPALEGTLRALKAAKYSKVKKVIVTSSMATIAYGHKKKLCSPADWTLISNQVGTYVKSKTIAEKAAWEFIENDPNKSFSITTIHPGMVLGPLLSSDAEGASSTFILKMISGKLPALPKVFFTIVDVRDVAKLHVDSLKNEKSNNKRVIATSPIGINIMEISNILRKNGYYRAPKKFIPTKIIKILALFNKEMKNMATMISRGSYNADISETISLYNWSQIALEDTLIDMCKSLEKLSIKK